MASVTKLKLASAVNRAVVLLCHCFWPDSGPEGRRDDVAGKRAIDPTRAASRPCGCPPCNACFCASRICAIVPRTRQRLSRASLCKVASFAQLRALGLRREALKHSELTFPSVLARAPPSAARGEPSQWQQALPCGSLRYDFSMAIFPLLKYQLFSWCA